MRKLPFATALAFLFSTAPTMAADCTIDHLGKRYNAQVEITLGDPNNPSRVWVYSGSGAPMVRFTAPNLIEVLADAYGTGTDGSGLNACGNALEVFDALALAQRNYNQCVGVSHPGQGTSTQLARYLACEADAG